MAYLDIQSDSQEVHKVNQQSNDEFVREVMENSGQNILACYQCRRCAAGCPVANDTMTITPDKLIRMVIMGDSDNALNNDLVWGCVSCHTCGTRCPNNIRTGKVVESLKKMAGVKGIDPLKPAVNNFHCSFFNDSMRWGRVNEIGLMGEYEARNAFDNVKRNKFMAIVEEIKSQSKFAWQMLKHGRLHFTIKRPSANGRREISRLLNNNSPSAER